MNEHAGPAPISSTDLDNLGSPNGDVGISSFATRDATLAALNPNAEVPGSDDDDDDETSTTTGLNPDPDYEKSAGAAELMTPDDAPGPDDDDALSSEDTDDDRG